MKVPDNWALFPVHRPVFATDGSVSCGCGTPGCGNYGKHPAWKWGELVAGEKVPFDDDVYNVGIATGQRSGVFVVDLDVKPSMGVDGFARLMELVAQHGEMWPSTLTVRTPSGGWHFYFRWPGFQVQNSASKLAPGIDVRGDGGYTVLPPSLHKSGKLYEFFDMPSDPEWNPDSVVAVAPQWLLARVARSAGADGAPFPIPDIPRPDIITTLEGWEIINRSANNLRKIPLGQRNEVLFLEAARLGDWSAAGDINTADAYAVMCRSITSLGWDNLEKCFDTVKNGLDKGSNRDRPMLLIGPRNELLNHQAISALARRDDVYVVGNKLARDSGESISAMNPDNLEEILSDCVDWRQKGKDGALVQIHPPDWAVRGVFSRGSWPELRLVEGHSEVPIFRRDGTIATKKGYDPHTRVVLSRNWNEEGQILPAADAVALFRDLFCDFCFENEAHLGTTMAALLTPLAMRAFDGPAPMFMFNASRAAAGKSKLANICATIANGRPAQLMVFTENEEEMRKAITTQARNPMPLVFLDNIGKNQTFGGSALCAALTSPDRMWSDRILGKNEAFRGKMSWAWYASGNNCKLGADMNSRICPIRLVPLMEKPEFRTGFRHDPIEQWVEANKEAYMWAALSLLVGFVQAGSPAPTGMPWRGYSGWRSLIVGCVEWAGFGDLDATRIVHEEDDGTSALTSAIRTFWTAHGDFTVREAFDACYQGLTPPHAKELRKALDGLFPRGPTSVQLGGMLRQVRDIYSEGFAVTEARTRATGNVARWTVVRGGQ